MRQIFPLCLALGVLSALSACADAADEDLAADTRDPLIEQALGDQLLADLDLATQNEANAALTVAFDSSIPPQLSGPESRARARAAMRSMLLKGGEIADLPASDTEQDWPHLASALTAAERASRIGFAKECAERLNYSAIWAARLPDYAVMAPHGAVTEAAGNPESQCNIRIVSYLTDLPIDEVMQFHFNLAKRAKLSPLYTDSETNEDDAALLAISNRASIAVHARERGDAQTEVDVISREFAGQ
jgi:hypothetical protein